MSKMILLPSRVIDEALKSLDGSNLENDQYTVPVELNLPNGEKIYIGKITFNKHTDNEGSYWGYISPNFLANPED